MSEGKFISVWSNGTALADTLVSLFDSHMQSSSSFSLYSSNYTSANSIFQQQPFFNKGLLIKVYTEGMKDEDIDKLLPLTKKQSNAVIIFICNSMKSFNHINDLFGSQIKQISCYKPPDWLVQEYLSTHMSKRFTTTAFKVFMFRMQGQWKYLDNYINDIETITEASLVTDDIVKKIIPVFTKLNLDTILINLIHKSLTKKDFKCLYSFKYAYKFIFTELTNRINDLIAMKLDYLNGILSYKSLAFYAKEKNYKDYVVKNYLDNILTQTSLEYLYKWKYILHRYSSIRDGFLLMILEVSKKNV